MSKIQQKGLKVEVSKMGSWWPAEIISGNGHTYHVKYVGHQPGMSAVAERVPRKVIRPLPPSVDGMMYWSPGDIVEAPENHSWKPAQVSSAAAGDYYFVRILGPSKCIVSHKSELRVRQAWKDNHWVIIRKDAARFKDGKKVVRRPVVGREFNSPAHQPVREVKNHEVERQVPHKDRSGFEECRRKRRRICLSELNHTENGLADAPREVDDAQSVSSSVGSCSPCSSPSSSVGSCSPRSSPCSSSCNPTTCPTQQYDNLLDDDDAYCHSTRKVCFPKEDTKRWGESYA